MTKVFHTKPRALTTALIAGLVFILILSAAAMIFVHTLYGENFPRYDRPEYSGRLQLSDLPADSYSAVHFPSGKNCLAGFIFGQENTKGLVVVAPGRGEGVEHYLGEILYFAGSGWRVFSFDYTGSYSSEGMNSVGLPQSRTDLEAALAYIQSDDTLNGLPLLLWGHSWGGYAVAAVLQDHPNISAVVSIFGFNSPNELMGEYMRGQIGVLGYVMVPFEWAYQTLRFGSRAGATAVDSINRSAAPVMIVHGSADDSILYAGASIIAHRAQITSPGVVYKTCSAQNHNGHKDLLRSEAAVQYSNQKNQEYRALYEQYDGAIPDSAKAEFYAGVDRFLTSEPDADLMNEFNDFFERALQDD